VIPVLTDHGRVPVAHVDGRLPIRPRDQANIAGPGASSPPRCAYRRAAVGPKQNIRSMKQFPRETLIPVYPARPQISWGTGRYPGALRVANEFADEYLRRGLDMSR
jgi:hypothetical protein